MGYTGKNPNIDRHSCILVVLDPSTKESLFDQIAPAPAAYLSTLGHLDVGKDPSIVGTEDQLGWLLFKDTVQTTPSQATGVVVVMRL